MSSSSENKKEDKRSGVSAEGVLVGALVAGAVFMGGWLLSSLWGSNDEEKEKSSDSVLDTYSITRDTKQRVAAEARRTTAVDDVPQGNACVVCLTKERQMLFNSCGHVCMCEACVVAAAGGANAREDVTVVLRCPMCRREGTVRRIYC